MAYKVLFRSDKVAIKDISRIPKKTLDNIFSKVNKLSINWVYLSQVKKLNNYNVCDYRLRVWDYRVLFNIDEEKKEIIIFRILHRSKLY